MAKAEIVKELIKRGQAGQEAALQFLHNTSPEKLKRILGMGGMPMPSIGITKKDIPFENFGDITLVGKPASFDPKATKLNQAFSADAYTVRAPSPVRVAKKGAGKKFQEGVGAKLKAEGKYIDETSSNLWGLERKGGVNESEYNQVKQFLDSDELMDEFFEPGELFISNPSRDQYTTRAKLLPYDAETVAKHMKRQSGRGGEGGMSSHGLGAQRASTTEEFKTLAGMRKRQGDLVSKEQMDSVKSQGEDKFFELADELKRYYKYEGNSFRYLDEVGELITMSEKRGLPGAFKEIGFEDVPDDLVADINAYKDKLRSSPTEYFESKPKRVVDLEEFGGAIVPEGTPKETIDMLQKKGLRIEKYKDNAGRLAARSKFQDLAFQGTGAALGLGAASSVVSPKSQASYQQAVDELKRRGRTDLIPGARSDKMEASKYPVLGKAANLFRGVDTPMGNPFESTTNMLDAWSYGEHPDKLDYLFAPMELLDPSGWSLVGPEAASEYQKDYMKQRDYPGSVYDEY